MDKQPNSTERVEIDIAALAREGKPAPEHKPGFVYRFKVNNDEKLGESTEPIVKGRYILSATGRTPVEKWELDQVFPNKPPQPVGYDDDVDLAGAGIEKFAAVENAQNEG